MSEFKTKFKEEQIVLAYSAKKHNYEKARNHLISKYGGNKNNQLNSLKKQKSIKEYGVGGDGSIEPEDEQSSYRQS